MRNYREYNMSTRTLLTTAFVALLMAAPLTANAATMRHHRSVHHAAMPHHGRHMAMSHRAMSSRAAPRDAGSSAVDALNQRSLDQARGGGVPAAQ